MVDCAGVGSARQCQATVIEDVLASLPAKARILDVGCGQGVPILVRTNRSFTGIGLDSAQGQLRRAKMNVPIAPLVHGDMRTLPFQENTFDVITASHSITHVPDRHQRTVITEFARVLRPSGQLLVLTNTSKWGDTPTMGEHTGSIDVTRERLVAAGFSVNEEGTANTGLVADETVAVHFLRADYAK